MPNSRRGPFLPNLDAYHAMGVDPNTGLPYRWTNGDETLKEDIKRMLRIVDEEDSIGRFKWTGLPPEIDPELLERIIFYHG